MHYNDMTIEELRERWAEAWGQTPHLRISRKMLERSLLFKEREQQGNCLSADQQDRLNQLVSEYKRNQNCFDTRVNALKPGTRLVRIYNGKKHSVLVKTNGFEYEGRDYSSLSKIANDITGSRWNGWLFFGLKE